MNKGLKPLVYILDEQGHFLDRASDCYQELGELDQAVRLRSSVTLEWRQSICITLETEIRQQLERKEFLAAIGSLNAVMQAWREKSKECEQAAT